jgi:hypothetical protein
MNYLNIYIMVRDLAFLKTWSIPQFKANNGIQEIEIKRNERTGKYFFVYGFDSGACSRKVETGELTMPMVSQVVSATTGEQFYLLHQMGEGGGATTICTL